LAFAYYNNLFNITIIYYYDTVTKLARCLTDQSPGSIKVNLTGRAELNNIATVQHGAKNGPLDAENISLVLVSTLLNAERFSKFFNRETA